MKKLLALILALMMALTCGLAALAEEAEATDETGNTEESSDSQNGAGANPYTIEGLGATIYLPTNVSVTNEEDTDVSVVLTLAMDGRQDCGLSISINYIEDYVGYYTSTLPEEALNQMIAYYNGLYTSLTGGDAAALQVLDENYPEFSPLYVSGKGEDGNLYSLYVLVCDGYQFTVSIGTSAEQFDQESYGTAFTLYWQVVDMIMGGSEE